MLKKVGFVWLSATGIAFGMQYEIANVSEVSQKASAEQAMLDKQFLHDKFWSAHGEWKSGKLVEISPIRLDSDDARCAKIFVFLGLVASIQVCYLDRLTYKLTPASTITVATTSLLKLNRLTEEALGGTLLEKLDQNRLE